MKSVAPFLVLALSAAPLTAHAEAGGAPVLDMVRKAFGNTIISTYPDGRTALLWLKASGEYSGKGRRRTSYSGAWTEKEGKLCLRQSRPIPLPFSFCTPIPSGSSWTGRAVTGEPVTFKLLPGVVEVPQTGQ